MVSDSVFSYAQCGLRFSLLLECYYFLLQFEPQSSSKTWPYKSSSIVRFIIVCPIFIIHQFNSSN